MGNKLPERHAACQRSWLCHSGAFFEMAVAKNTSITKIIKRAIKHIANVLRRKLVSRNAQRHFGGLLALRACSAWVLVGGRARFC